MGLAKLGAHYHPVASREQGEGKTCHLGQALPAATPLCPGSPLAFPTGPRTQLRKDIFQLPSRNGMTFWPRRRWQTALLVLFFVSALAPWTVGRPASSPTGSALAHMSGFH